jgi:hypothetical protein
MPEFADRGQMCAYLSCLELFSSSDVQDSGFSYYRVWLWLGYQYVSTLSTLREHLLDWRDGVGIVALKRLLSTYTRRQRRTAAPTAPSLERETVAQAIAVLDARFPCAVRNSDAPGTSLPRTDTGSHGGREPPSRFYCRF